MSETGQLLSQLEELAAVKLDPEGDLQLLVGNLQKRQVLLDQVQKHDMAAIPKSAVDNVREKLTYLHDDTQRALCALAERRKSLANQAEQVVTARHAARGYRPDNPKKSRSVDTEA
ncbi:MAG: hypothetical protein OXU20_15890 [Myxococcales bacterium]|nr:hypothetical protein [Myxococcales bacterium]